MNGIISSGIGLPLPLPEVGINWEAIRIYIKIIDLFNYGRQLVCAPPPKKPKHTQHKIGRAHV